MTRSMGYFLNKLRQDGPRAIIERRLRWYRNIVATKCVRSRTIGRVVELLGNRVRIDGLVFSTDSPVIDTRDKSAMLVALYELSERTLVGRWLPAHLPIVEFGGGLGIVSCVANRKLAKREQHVVVEANPRIVGLLEQNRDLNHCGFQVVNKALAYGAESVKFTFQSNFLSGRVGDESAEVATVPATSLQAVADASGFDQISVICDAEGAEAFLVKQELETLRQRVRFLLVEIHPEFLGNEGVSQVVETLEASGFTLRERSGDNWAFTRD
jgi:FkbM family methyltransferase